ncbi:MAG: EamA family transporter [Methylobacteriaceae bacterium]|jgi:drug/metabolite transporter (DMT)-like permease|nr:EamA family transporter [Methylobacteriaceae bacterium]
MDISLLWIPAGLVAAAAQTGRNAAQAGLTKTLGPVGAAHIRFLYALPFPAVILPILLIVLGESLPSPGGRYWMFLLLGSVLQISAMVLMLWAMDKRSFSVVTALTKTEPVQVALFAAVFLSEHFPPVVWCAICLATAGVVITVLRPSKKQEGPVPGLLSRTLVIGAGVASGACFALCSLCLQIAVRDLTGHSPVVQSTTTLVLNLAAQTIILIVLMSLFDKSALIGGLKVWKSSLGVGFLGAVASFFWFFAFALASAANVRTLGLIEVLMAYFASRSLLHQNTTRREILGMAMIVVGVLLLLWRHVFTP